MAITINWATKVINVPKADTTLVQPSPEIRELDLNTFRLTLKALEADTLGMAYLRTNKHVTETLLGGVTYARIIEIINGYTVTFEDGQYAVNLTGANSNVGDVINVNQVSVRSFNSAGLVVGGSGVTEQDKADIAAKVWDEEMTTHTTANTFGERVKTKLLDVSKFIGLS